MFSSAATTVVATKGAVTLDYSMTWYVWVVVGAHNAGHRSRGAWITGLGRYFLIGKSLASWSGLHDIMNRLFKSLIL